MTIQEFLTALPSLKEDYCWYEDERGQLYALRFDGEGVGWKYSTITALAYKHFDEEYDSYMEWEQAAQTLDLTLCDALRIVSAEDQDSVHEPWLALALRQAVGIQAHRYHRKSSIKK